MIGLAQELFHVHLAQFGDVRFQDGGATDDDRLSWLFALDTAANFDTGKEGQIQVEQNDRERFHAREKAHALRSVRGLDDLETLASQELCDQAAKEMFVLDQ